MSNPADMFGGGSSGGGMRYVQVPRTNEQRRDEFQQGYNRAFDGNDRYKESLSGFYGGQPFQDIVARITQQNTFQRQKPQMKLVPKGDDSGSGIFDTLYQPLNFMHAGLF